MADYIPPNVPLFLTPDNLPSGVFCRTLGIPDDPTWNALVDGALTPLMEPEAWRQLGSLTPQECADAWRAMMYASWQGALLCDMVETPFWDNATDAEDSEDAETQPWYGTVSNPTAPPGELDFVESVALWIFTGLVAIATFEVGGIAPAIVFHTTVEKFIIIQKRGDVAETIRFVVDGQDAKFVNTAPYAPGDLIETPIMTPQTGGDHELMIIGGSS